PTALHAPVMGNTPTVRSTPSVPDAPTVLSAPTASDASTMPSAPTVPRPPTASSAPTVPSAPVVPSASAVSSAPIVHSTATVPTAQSASAAPTAHGTSVPAVPKDGERKQVTVLLTDVFDFTSISSQLDPEDLHDIMDRCVQTIIGAVQRYEGTVAQFVGDGVMALFGAPIAHEDHPHRA